MLLSRTKKEVLLLNLYNHNGLINCNKMSHCTYYCEIFFIISIQISDCFMDNIKLIAVSTQWFASDLQISTFWPLNFHK